MPNVAPPLRRHVAATHVTFDRRRPYLDSDPIARRVDGFIEDKRLLAQATLRGNTTIATTLEQLSRAWLTRLTLSL